MLSEQKRIELLLFRYPSVPSGLPIHSTRTFWHRPRKQTEGVSFQFVHAGKRPVRVTPTQQQQQQLLPKEQEEQGEEQQQEQQATVLTASHVGVWWSRHPHLARECLHTHTSKQTHTHTHTPSSHVSSTLSTQCF